MNVFDLIVYLTLALAVWDGWRKGVILQVCSLAGIVGGIWLAARYGTHVGAWLHLDSPIATSGGFIVVLVVTIIAVAIAGRLLRKMLHFVGLGLPDIIFGIAISVAKCMLLLGVVFGSLDKFNKDYGLVQPQTIEESRWFRPVVQLSDFVFPFLDWMGDQIHEEK